MNNEVFIMSFMDELEKAAVVGQSLSRSQRAGPGYDLPRKALADFVRSSRKTETKSKSRLQLAGMRGIAEAASKKRGNVGMALSSIKNLIKQKYRDAKF